MDTLRQDLKFAFRMLVKDRGFAVTAIITLALCIGANSALFTIVQSVLLRPLPFPESSRLVFTYDSFPGAGVERAGTSVPNYVDRAKLTDVFDRYALYQWGGFRVGQGQLVGGRLGDERDAVVFPRAARRAEPRPSVHRRRRAARAEQGCGPQPRVRREAGRRRRRHRRTRHPARRPAVSCRRRPARKLHVPEPGSAGLRAAGLHRPGQVGRAALQPEPRRHRPPRAGRDDRSRRRHASTR